MYFVCSKEFQCVASARRKSVREHLATGPRLDGVVRTVEADRYEYGVLEVGRKWEGINSTKSLGNSWKIILCMHDMLRRLHERVNNRADVIHKLQVVGILTLGLRLHLIRLCHPKGYVCLLIREKGHSVASVASELEELLRLLVRIVQCKASPLLLILSRVFAHI